MNTSPTTYSEVPAFNLWHNRDLPPIYEVFNHPQKKAQSNHQCFVYIVDTSSPEWRRPAKLKKIHLFHLAALTSLEACDINAIDGMAFPEHNAYKIFLHQQKRTKVFTFPRLFCMESTRNPWNPSGIPCGVHGINIGWGLSCFLIPSHHGFHVEWWCNGHGMMNSMWESNTIPSGFHWIPYGMQAYPPWPPWNNPPVLHHAPLIPAGEWHRNPQEWAGMDRNGTGMDRNGTGMD